MNWPGSIAPGEDHCPGRRGNRRQAPAAQQVRLRQSSRFSGATFPGQDAVPGRSVEPETLDEAPRGPGVRGEGAGTAPDILRADVDVSVFRPATILLLDTMGKDLRENSSTLKAFLSLNSGRRRTLPRKCMRLLWTISSTGVTGRSSATWGRPSTATIPSSFPWGALHMKEIEEEVLKRGFKLQAERERVSVDFQGCFWGPLTPPG